MLPVRVCGCRTIYQSMGSLSRAVSLEKMTLSLPVAISYLLGSGWDLTKFSPTLAGILSGLILCKWSWLKLWGYSSTSSQISVSRLWVQSDQVSHLPGTSPFLALWTVSTPPVPQNIPSSLQSYGTKNAFSLLFVRYLTIAVRKVANIHRKGLINLTFQRTSFCLVDPVNYSFSLCSLIFTVSCHFFWL